MDDSTANTILILGGSGGIGRATAARLRERGLNVVLAARDQRRLDEASRACGGAPTHTVDATDLDAVADLVKRVDADHGGLHGIVNAVGSILIKPAHTTSEEEWRHTVSANLDSAFATVRAAGRTLGRRGGSVVLMASAAARTGLPSHEAVAAAKAGVIGLGLSAAATYAAKNLRFNVVAPGMVDTPMAAAILANAMVRTASEKMHPLGRIGAADDVASCIAWLLDPGTTWVTGQVIGVDGGLGTVRGKASV
jgi:NAD(P)-dependent dehydrogenase (short-subunit alcohol dehydrogenase family)